MKALAKLPLWLLGFVTLTVTAPAALAGVVAVRVVLLPNETFVAAVVPNVTVAPETKFVPVIVTLAPPAVVPVFGDTPVTVGAVEEYVNPLERLPLNPAGFVTVTPTALAAFAGVIAVMVVPFVTDTFVAEALPNVTVAPETKFVPVIVTAVPPAVEPALGDTPVTVGAGAVYVYAPARLPLCPLGFVTVIVTAPSAFAGVVAVMVVLFVKETLVAEALPNVTVAPETKFVPVIVTAVPPAVEPVLGDTPVTVGAGTVYVYALTRLPLCPLGFVTVTVTAPAPPAGVVAVIVVLLVTETFVAAAAPNVTAAPATKFAPVIVTLAPPAIAPVFGATVVTVGDGDELPPP